ncbi:MAG: superfamily II RNA helicase [Bacillariaceae sp.]|jgi:superfamily II RNA helicase
MIQFNKYAVVIICSSLVVLTHRVYSFPVFLASDHQRYRTKGRPILSPPRSTPKEGNAESSEEIKEAIELGRSELGKYFDFPLDDWQLQAGGDILNGHNVIVCAPTGSGKTVVGEMALHTAFDRDLDGIYTTPLKALSNQKYTDFRQLFGRDNVGLSTGDVSINREKARLTVMTTEVYRNIAWRSSAQSSEIDFLNSNLEEELVSNNKSRTSNDLRKNAMVVLDEFHYMGQPGRGGVWEECVITSPAHTQIIGLSATLPNALELAKWMESVTGRSTKLIEAPGARPVPLKYLFATREGLFPLFRNADAGPGSSLGLLGYRGDGVPEMIGTSKIKKNNDFLDEEENDYLKVKNLPKGLLVNPILNSLAQRRVQKVNKMLERQKSRNDNFDRSDWSQGSGRGRGRRSTSSSFQTTSRVARKERERLTRREMRKAVPSLMILLTRLKEKNLLPAIFFIFSRKGCDETAENICNGFKGPLNPNVDLELDEDFQKSYKKKGDNERKRKKRDRTKSGRSSGNKKGNSNNLLEDEQGRSFRLSSNNVDENVFNSVLDANGIFAESDVIISGSPVSSENWKFYSSAGLLNYDEVQQVAGRVAQFNDENPEIAFSDDVVEQLMFGLGRHHAGMLPAHKMLIENLFRNNLMKAVFATEVSF